MGDKYDIDAMDGKVQEIKAAARKLMEIGGNIEAVKRNLIRILASIKMLEMNISDVREVL
jgi:hypothetical protein